MPHVWASRMNDVAPASALRVAYCECLRGNRDLHLVTLSWTSDR